MVWQLRATDNTYLRCYGIQLIVGTKQQYYIKQTPTNALNIHTSNMFWALKGHHNWYILAAVGQQNQSPGVKFL
jgi:hypothetical protein